MLCIHICTQFKGRSLLLLPINRMFHCFIRQVRHWPSISYAFLLNKSISYLMYQLFLDNHRDWFHQTFLMKIILISIDYINFHYINCLNLFASFLKIFLSMCDVKIFLTFMSPNMVLLWQLFYLFCSCI